MRDKKILTVFTPAYNRADKLKRLYESLLGQTNGAFLWLVVDDGSEDDTGELIHSFQREGKLEIRYTRQENGGKMRAHNLGVKLADTPLFARVLVATAAAHLPRGLQKELGVEE